MSDCDEDIALAALAEADDDAPIVHNRILGASSDAAPPPPRVIKRTKADEALEALKSRKRPTVVVDLTDDGDDDDDDEEPPGESVLEDNETSSDDPDLAAIQPPLAESDDGDDDFIVADDATSAAATADSSDDDDDDSSSVAPSSPSIPSGRPVYPQINDQRKAEMRNALILCAGIIADAIIAPEETASVLSNRDERERLGLTRRVIGLFNQPSTRGEQLVDGHVRGDELMAAMRKRPFIRARALPTALGSPAAPIRCDCCHEALHRGVHRGVPAGAINPFTDAPYATSSSVRESENEYTVELVVFGEKYDRDAVSALGAPNKPLVYAVIAQRGWFRYVVHKALALPTNLHRFRVHRSCASRMQAYSRCVHHAMRVACAVHDAVDKLPGSQTARAEAFSANAAFHSELYDLMCELMDDARPYLSPWAEVSVRSTIAI